MSLSRNLPLFLLSLAFVTTGSSARAADWIHWRGPEQNGFSREKNLPGEFNPANKAQGNVVWTAPYGGRCAPLVMDGRVYVLQGTGSGLEEAEQMVCVNEKTGKLLWTYRVNVFHTDIVSTRLAWAPLTGDPATGHVYAQTTGGLLLCIDKAGKLVWQRSLTEEYGRASGYGGRIPAPIFDSGLVIVGMISSSWGDFARGTNRFVALDGKTGQVVWWFDAGFPSKETYCSHPIVAVLNGQRVLLSGGGDGYLHAFKVRTGERVWSYQYCAGATNPAPMVDGNLIYAVHGDENPEGGPYGRIICLDASKLDKSGKPTLVWEFRKSVRFGLASPALAEGRLYAPDDVGELHCFNAKTGKPLWKYRYANEVRGSPLVADGKIYINDVQRRMHIITLKGNEKPDALDTFEYQFKEPKGIYSETNGTPIAVNGHVYFVSAASLWCLGLPDAKPEPAKYTPMPEETPFKENAIAGARLFPADVVLKPGEKVQFQVVFVDANGREVKDNRPSPAPVWSLPLPAKTPTGAQPPALQGTVANGELTVAPVPSQQGHVEFDSDGIKARARVRVAALVPWKQDFEKAPAGSSPGGWVNANGKFSVVKLPDGNQVLMKSNNDPRPPLAKANAFITMPDAANYTIQADLMGTQVRGGMGDFGLINSRYTLVLDGKTDPDSKKRQLRLVSWEARPRITRVEDFDWQPDVWYTAKLTIEHKEKTAIIRGKVWKKGDPEPEAWTVELEDPSPNRVGAAGLYGYVTNSTAIETGANCYYDNIVITPNAKK
ncbi:Probable serine/threonine protein kinase related protein OS=Planctomyces maris DSM 8797 GN=PM8797T_21603 PE=4 SV=1: PQQ_2: PQQ_2: PQQ_2 [Gemmata massiliana]|uniref:Pyrrolo-quinoline quinone repeat domain-containing protein n=1 Tax=Gemmata massiliana TaxID=1210884 RepID=A0A6P2D8C9_9BACT|nr:PQQ-binding-like beta-propeller repeat protein [Gemmata massiliana]VTR95772.1 Probable serine/threonine protein kinase related protein OS=Planctomyces maris DSM 8797 GN=PM8797T_21603 PE=4 SV=1: PQQ_2: PQQ_2: PQQ_2 [Gemmata massiliana]